MKQVAKVIVAWIGSAMLFVVFFVLSGCGEGYCYFYPSIDTRYATGYSEKAFQSITPGMTRPQVDAMMCAPLGVWTNLDATVDYDYTRDGKSWIGDFAWFGREVRFSNDVVVATESRIYYD